MSTKTEEKENTNDSTGPNKKWRKTHPQSN